MLTMTDRQTDAIIRRNNNKKMKCTVSNFWWGQKCGSFQTRRKKVINILLMLLLHRWYRHWPFMFMFNTHIYTIWNNGFAHWPFMFIFNTHIYTIWNNGFAWIARDWRKPDTWWISWQSIASLALSLRLHFHPERPPGNQKRIFLKHKNAFDFKSAVIIYIVSSSHNSCNTEPNAPIIMNGAYSVSERELPGQRLRAEFSPQPCCLPALPFDDKHIWNCSL